MAFRFPWAKVPSRATLATLVFGVLVTALVGTSPSRLIGDGTEYLALAHAVAGRGHDSLATATHFWMYPALAAPFVVGAELLALPETTGFALLNAGLLLLAFWLIARELGVPAAVFVGLGPVIWWVDKAHTEVFTVALLSMAFARRDSPWSPVAVGLAATQNPPLAVLIPLLLADWWIRRRRGGNPDGRPGRTSMWIGVAFGVLFAALPAIYYQVTRGVLNPLVGTTQRETPTLREFLVVVSDPNLGVVFGYPILPLLVLGAGAWIVARRGVRRVLDVTWVPAVAAGCFLWAFAHVTNFNHGATPGMSRYALWLIPLAIPLLRELRSASSSGIAGRALPVVAIASVLWSLAFFRPSLPEALGEPSTAARLVWHVLPALDNPLPEVFVERNSGRETNGLPVAEPGCAKLLLLGDGQGTGMWPVPCRPTAVPPVCRHDGALCYANRAANGYRFTLAAPRSYHAFQLRNAVWPPDVEPFVRGLLSGEGWREAGVVRAGQSGVMVRAAHAVRRSHSLQGPDRLFVCLVEPRPGARLDLRVPAGMRAEVLDLRTGRRLSEVHLSGRGLESVVLPAASDLIALVAVSGG